jgi:hypothetical protein
MQQSVNVMRAIKLDVATLTQEALKASRESATRVVKILADLPKRFCQNLPQLVAERGSG